MREASCRGVLCAALFLGCGQRGGGAGTDAGADASSHGPACLQHAPDDYRVKVDGVGFGEHDGTLVYVVTEMTLASTPATCRIAGSTRIAGGHFGMQLVNLTDGAAYPLVGAFLDGDGDGSCEASTDLIWSSIFSLSPSSNVMVSLTAADFSHVDDGDVCGRFSSSHGDSP